MIVPILTLNNAVACANVWYSSVYLIALDLKSLSYAIQKLYDIFSCISSQLAIFLSYLRITEEIL